MSKSRDLWMDYTESLGKDTRALYFRRLAEAMEYIGVKDHDELYGLQLQCLKSDDPRDRQTLENKVVNLVNQVVRDGRLKGSSARDYVKAMSSFMKAMGLPFHVDSKRLPKFSNLGRKIILREQIRVIYEKPGTEFWHRNRALTMFLKDSGLRISDVRRYNVCDYLDAPTFQHETGTFKDMGAIATQKTSEYAYVYLGPETVEAVDAYLEQRKAGAHEPLFLDRDGKRMTSDALTQLFMRLSERLLDGDRIGAHSFRKFQQTQLEAAGVNGNWIKRYQGRKVKDSTGVYSNPQDIPGQLLETYIEHYDALKVYEVKQALEKRIEERDDEVQQLRRTIEEMMPTFRAAQRMMEERDILKKIQGV
jgi:integrase